MRTIFVFAYYSIKDPIFQSAVLPYLKLMRGEMQFVLLTWEQEQFNLEEDELNEVKSDLAAYGIIWRSTKWHSGIFKMPKKIYDFAKGLLISWRLIVKYRADKIYSEGFPGAIIGHFLSKATGIKHVIHTFEPHADYMVEAGVWTRRSWEYRFLKKMEIPVALHADCIITATEGYKNVLLSDGVKNIQVIPSCIDPNLFHFMPNERYRIRKSLKIEEGQIAIVYLGKIGGMYMDDEIFAFFKNCLDINFDKFTFLLLTNEPLEAIDKYLAKYNIPKEKILIKWLPGKEVPAYLSAADVGFCGIKPIPSRRFSSPIKNGEYWACGLPILIPKGISDDYIISQEEKIGFVFEELEQIDFHVLESLKALDRSIIEERGHFFRSLERYKSQFQRILR